MKHLLIELSSVLQVQKIDYVILKGIPLDTLLHNNNCSRVSVDIDILIHPQQLLEVHKIVSSLGYELRSAISSEQLMNGCVFMIAVGKDLTYWHLKTGMHIELHWKTTVMSEPGFFTKDTQVLPLSQQHQVTIFDPENNFVYLCMHAAWHNWEQLQWLLDLALLTNKFPLHWPKVVRLLQEKRAMRPVLEAKILLSQRFHIHLPYIPYSWRDKIAVIWRLQLTKKLLTSLEAPKHIVRVFYNAFLHKTLWEKCLYMWSLLLHRQSAMSQLRMHPNRSRIVMLFMSFFRKGG